MHGEIGDRHIELHILVERDKFLRKPRIIRVLDQGLAALLLLDLAGARQQRFQVAIFDDELRGGLHADAGNTRHVVRGIADQGLHLDHLVRRHAEFLEYFRRADALVLHGVVEHHRVADELHQVFIRRYNGGRRLGFAGEPRISGDQVVGLEAGLFEAGNIEGAHRLADQRELRNEIVGWRRAVGFVFAIHVAAEGFFRLVEDHGQMGWPIVGRHLLQQLPQHIAEAEHGIDLQPVGLAGQRRQRVIGAENIAGPVHQEEMVSRLQRARCGKGFRVRPGCGGLGRRRLRRRVGFG